MQRLQQVLLNLLSNALKFTDRGGSIKITSRFVVTEHDLTFKEPELIKLVETAKYGMLEVSVADNGIGIKQEDLGKLFKLFGFLDSSKELNTKGIGLGLHISKMICQTFGGDIVVHSEFGKGTTFTFLFALENDENIEGG